MAGEEYAIVRGTPVAVLDGNSAVNTSLTSAAWGWSRTGPGRWPGRYGTHAEHVEIAQAQQHMQACGRPHEKTSIREKSRASHGPRA